MRYSWIILVVAVVLSLGRAGWALDPKEAVGVGGIGSASHVTGAWGRSTEDGLAHPGFPSKVGSGMVGVTPGGVTGETNKGTDDGYHAAGLGKVITAGVGRSTMETVPGRSPTYVNVVAGTRTAPLVGARGP